MTNEKSNEESHLHELAFDSLVLALDIVYPLAHLLITLLHPNFRSVSYQCRCVYFRYANIVTAKFKSTLIYVCYWNRCQCTLYTVLAKGIGHGDYFPCPNEIGDRRMAEHWPIRPHSTIAFWVFEGAFWRIIHCDGLNLCAISIQNASHLAWLLHWTAYFFRNEHWTNTWNGIEYKVNYNWSSILVIGFHIEN